MKKLHNRVIAIILSVLMINSFILPSISTVNASSDIKVEMSKHDVESLIPLFKVIEEIPIELLEKGSGEEISEYFRNKNVNINVYNDQIGEEEESSETAITTYGNIWKCAISIGQLLVTVGLPATQLVKIKNYIASLGGVWSTVQLLVGATSVSEKLKGALIGLSGILSTLTGIDGIKENCLG